MFRPARTIPSASAGCGSRRGPAADRAARPARAAAARAPGARGAQIVLDRRAESSSVRADDPPIAIDESRAPSAARRDRNPHPLAAQPDLAAVLPLARAMLLQHALALALDPATLSCDEIARLPLRSPARHRDAQRSVGPDPEDVRRARGVRTNSIRSWDGDGIDRWRMGMPCADGGGATAATSARSGNKSGRSKLQLRASRGSLSGPGLAPRQ